MEIQHQGKKEFGIRNQLCKKSTSKGDVDSYDKGHNKDSQPQDILTSQSHMQRGSKGNQIRT